METNEKEIWKVLNGLNENYSISNFGRVKNNCKNFIRKLQHDKDGYLCFTYTINKKRYTKRVHQLVAIYFLNHIPNGIKDVVNHIDGNVANNNLTNLEIVTHRYNCSVAFLKNKENFSSNYVGVTWHKEKRKWHSQIRINKKKVHIGYFKTELEASNAYQKKLNNHGRLDKN